MILKNSDLLLRKLNNSSISKPFIVQLRRKNMKAVIQTKSGPPEVLKLIDIEKPTPEDYEMLIKVHAATVTKGDTVLRKLPRIVWPLFRLLGMRVKKIPGYEFAGEIEKVGRNVKQFKKGDQVFGTTTGTKSGTNIEYICLPEVRKKGVLAKKPINMTFEESAAVPIGAMAALYILKGKIKKGDKVLIYGASGSVGTYAVQLAKYFGVEVTGVCSTKNIEMVKSIGASNVIDYTKEDFTKRTEKYNVIFDAVIKTSKSACKDILKEEGVFLSIRSFTKEENENLIFLKKIIEEGKLKAVIDSSYPLEKIVEAHKYVDQGHKKGNVVITMIPNNKN